jgi:RNA polymerase sigma factor (sigma-70 family)
MGRCRCHSGHSTHGFRQAIPLTEKNTDSILPWVHYEGSQRKIGMGTAGLQKVVEHLWLADAGLTDGQLLTRFLDLREEPAFAALVRRHGPMVLGVCRRVLSHAEDAEDAFQATFLVLARKAASVNKREAVASFLYGVAYRTALRAREQAARRRTTERQVVQMPEPAVAPAEAQDWRPVLDRELSRLPAKYQSAIVLCDLEGKTRREAAGQLGLREGTLASRLATARRTLARRLAKRGLALSAAAMAAMLEGTALAAVPAPWVSATARAATLVATGQAAALTTPAALLMNEVLKAMLLTKLKVGVAAAVVTLLLFVGGLSYRASGQPPRPAYPTPTDLDILRKEVEILKLQVEVLQVKMRHQEAALQTLRQPPRGNIGGGAGPFPGGGVGPIMPGAEGGQGLGGRLPPSPQQAAEAALKRLRDAQDPESRRQAADMLERELKRLGQRLQAAERAPGGGK